MTSCVSVNNKIKMNDEPASKVFENMSACMTLTSSGDVKLNRNHLTSAWITPGFVVFVFYIVLIQMKKMKAVVVLGLLVFCCFFIESFCKNPKKRRQQVCCLSLLFFCFCNHFTFTGMTISYKIKKYINLVYALTSS